MKGDADETHAEKNSARAAPAVQGVPRYRCGLPWRRHPPL